jgi:hypothetical protein
MAGGLGEQGPWIPMELWGLAVELADRVGGRAVACGSAVNEGGGFFVYRQAEGAGSCGARESAPRCPAGWRPSRRLRLGGKRNTVQCSVNNCGIEGCVAVSRGGRNPIVNSATARFHGRSIVTQSLAEGHTQRSLGQRPRTRDRPITIGWLKANLTIANGLDFGEIQRIAAKRASFEATQWVEVGLQPTKARCFGN